MKTKVAPPDYKTADARGAPEVGHAAWKRAKVESGLEQAKDRSALIPADQVWRNLGLER